MAVDVSQRILQRELASQKPATGYRQIYSTRRFVKDLDIVNELAGHSGCVNALSWSRSGRLLASGSDDRHLNIHAYQPEDSTKQFQLRTTVATGHSQNIFSVKFMPHSSDNTVVTCAGDGDVRVFDLEYTGQASNASHASSMAYAGRQRGRNGVFAEVKYKTDGDTNARVYRSHADRVKRVVTEDSPYLFLTCSEDGEVRQWDTRQPSKYYPRPNGNTYVPPPLISYRAFRVDLNTISCSGSQPHYIALGGSHLHCFLHDRRMAGRSRVEESGRPASAPSLRSQSDEAIMAEATRCVRRFAPQGQTSSSPTERGHITACKISDARPDEIIVSWSHDHIYKFDMIREQNVHDENVKELPVKGRAIKKRKLRNRTSDADGDDEATSLPHNRDARTSQSALRIHYANGQQEDIAIRPERQTPPSSENRVARRITKAVLSLCQNVFDYAARGTDRAKRFTKSLGEAAAILEDIDEICRTHSYPINPTATEVAAQRRLKLVRERTRRFVQAAGCISRVLGGKLQTTSGNSPLLQAFITIETRSNDRDVQPAEQFTYDFIKAVILWVESGSGALIDGFTRPTSKASDSKAALRLPIPEHSAGIDSIHEYLGPYFVRLADDLPVFDLDSSPFHQQEYRQVYPTTQSAVQDFFSNVRIPFADMLPEEYNTEGDDSLVRSEMLDRWVYTVSRSLLHRCFLPVDFSELDVAFGGTGDLPAQFNTAVAALLDQTTPSDQSADMMQRVEESNELVLPLDPEDDDHSLLEPEPVEGEEQIDAEMYFSDEEADEEAIDDDDYDDNDDDSADDDHNDGEESSEPDEVDGVPYSRPSWAGYQTTRQRQQDQIRATLGAGVPCSGPLQSYEGHCNVKTVKDVNYYGLDDEYVVSGSDDKNLFIWDSKTGDLVNILEGDGEVVNVVQGHPYEPMLAVSGIDHTVKIFSPDQRARTVARLGREVSAQDPSTFSSLAWPFRPTGRRRGVSHGHAEESAETANHDQDQADVSEDDNWINEKGLHSRQRMHIRSSITAMNLERIRRGGDDSMLTSSYLRMVARYLRAQRAADQTGEAPDLPGVNIEEDEDGRTRIVVNDDCVLM